jgi:DNA mismatch repair ATPase MutL
LTDAGVESKATSIEVFVDVENGRITVVDNGQGITPDALSTIVSSSSFNILSSKNDFR